jgi:hypothetical protein
MTIQETTQVRKTMKDNRTQAELDIIQTSAFRAVYIDQTSGATASRNFGTSRWNLIVRFLH